MNTDGLPPGWARTTTGVLFAFVTSGSRGWAAYYAAEGANFLRIGNLTRASIGLDLEDIQRVQVPNTTEVERTRVQPGDILISITADIGSIGLVPDGLGEAYVNQHLALSRPHPQIDPTYLAWFLRSAAGGQRQFTSLRRGATKAGLGLDDIRAVEVPVAPLAEQRRIVARVEELFAELDEAVAELERVRANLKRYRASVLKAAVSGDLTADWRATHPNGEPASALLAGVVTPPRPNRWSTRTADIIFGHSALAVGNPGTPVPTNWSWVALADIARMESGHTPSREHPEWWDGSIPWIGIADAREHHGGWIQDTTQHTNDDGLANSAARLLPAGTVCISRTASVGYVVVMSRPMATSQDFVNWTPTDVVLADWLRVVFMADREALLRFGKGSVHQTIYFPEWLSVHIALPPLAEQEAIVAEVESRLTDVTAAEAVVSASLTRAARLRQSILKEAFAGRLVPQDPAEEPASVLLERIKAAKPTGTPAKKPRGRKAAPVGVNEAIVELLAFAVPSATDAGKLNRTKIQKFAAVLQTHHGVEIVERFLQAPFGPYAPEIGDMEPVCVERGYFTTKQEPREDGGFEVQYAAGENAEAGRVAGLKRLGEHAADAEKLLRLIREMTTDDAELFATVYAVWNDLLLDGKPADDAAITIGVYAWNVKKRKFKPTDIAAMIERLRATGYIPTGRGKHTEATRKGRKKV